MKWRYRLLRIPGKPQTDIPIYGSKPPTAEDVVILPLPLLKCMTTLGTLLKGCNAKWGIYGDAGEIVLGVNVKSDHLEILTTKEGAEEIAGKLTKYQSLPLSVAEKKLPREADIEGKGYPVYVKSNYAEFTINGVRIELYGDLQMKVGEWDWGDALDYTPVSISIIGTEIPIVPLRLRSELDLGLGWLDRVELISDAVMRSQHRH